MREILEREWQGLSVEKITNRCEAFRSKLELVLQNDGDNNFNG